MRAGPNAAIRSPSVSISATSTPSSEVPLIRPIARANFRHLENPRARPRFTRPIHMLRAARNWHAPRSDRKHDHLPLRLPAHPRGARLHPSVLRPGGARRACREGSAHRLCRLRLHRRRRCMSASPLDHDAALAAEDRRQADHADGRRHDARRRSVRQGRDAPHPDRRGDRGEQGEPEGGLRPLRRLRRTERGDHARQRRVAGAAQLHRLPARRRPAFLGQPDAQLQIR